MKKRSEQESRRMRFSRPMPAEHKGHTSQPDSVLQQLRLNTLPEINVAPNVMQIIRGRATRRSGRRIVAYCLLGAVLLLSGFSYSLHAWQLYHGDGSKSLHYSHGDVGESNALLQELVAQASPGEGIVVFNQEEGGEQTASAMKHVEYRDVNELRSAIAESEQLHPANTDAAVLYPIIDKLLTAPFLSGSVLYELAPPDVQQLERLRQAAAASDDGYAAEPAIVTKEVLGISAVYGTDSEPVLELFTATGERWHTLYSDLSRKQVEKVALGETEALFVQDQAEGKHLLLWLNRQEQSTVYYKLTADAAQVSKEELVGAAQQIWSNKTE